VRDEILVRCSSWRRFGRVPAFDEESMDRLLFFGSHLGSKLFKQVKTPGALLNDRVYPPQLSPVPRGSEEEVESSPEKKSPRLYRRPRRARVVCVRCLVYDWGNALSAARGLRGPHRRPVSVSAAAVVSQPAEPPVTPQVTMHNPVFHWLRDGAHPDRPKGRHPPAAMARSSCRLPTCTHRTASSQQYRALPGNVFR
jgi:hypothetical protein